MMHRGEQGRPRLWLQGWLRSLVVNRDASIEQIDRLARERGLRDRLLLVAGGTQVTDAIARECGMDAGFGRGTRGQDVGSFLVTRLRELESGAG